MRTGKIGNYDITYPDQLAFVHNPNYITINANVTMTVTISALIATYKDTREGFGGKTQIDISYYMRMLIDALPNTYKNYAPAIVQVTVGDDTLTLVFHCLRGSLAPGEDFKTSRTVRWFKNLPFTVSVYTPATQDIYAGVDGGSVTKAGDTSNNIFSQYNPQQYVPQAVREAVLMFGGIEQPDTFDDTFDDTFQYDNTSITAVRLVVDTCTDGVYLRWMDNQGMWQYWLFSRSGSTSKTEDDGDPIPVDFEAYGRAYGGISRQGKKEQTTYALYAPLVDGETLAMLMTLPASPYVYMYMGKDGDDDVWVPVTTEAGSHSITNEHLQDFEVNILLPPTQLQAI